MRRVASFLKDPIRSIYVDSFISTLISKRRKHLWLIAAPKSGSTWLTVILDNCLKWKQISLVPDYDRREQEADLRQIILQGGRRGNIFSPHQHCRYSDNTASIITQTGAKVILLCRNIFDTVLSVKDHLDRESRIIPMSYMDDESWNALADEQRRDFVIDMIIPWYFNFYCGWFKSSLINSGQVLITTYENLNTNTPEVIGEILDFIEVQKSKVHINDAISKSRLRDTRKNKGVVGRGATLTIKQRKRIAVYAKYWKDVDLTLIGIDKESP